MGRRKFTGIDCGAKHVTISLARSGRCAQAQTAGPKCAFLMIMCLDASFLSRGGSSRAGSAAGERLLAFDVPGLEDTPDLAALVRQPFLVQSLLEPVERPVAGR